MRWRLSPRRPSRLAGLLAVLLCLCVCNLVTHLAETSALAATPRPGEAASAQPEPASLADPGETHGSFMLPRTLAAAPPPALTLVQANGACHAAAPALSPQRLPPKAA